jgi:hypothetical protein
VLPLLAFVWFSSSAAPCSGMATDVEPRTDAATIHAEHYSVSDHDHDREAPGHDHQSCPHCPSAPVSDQTVPSASHISCNTLENLSDTSLTPAPGKADLKHALPAAPNVVPLTTLNSLRASSLPTGQIPPSPRLPLNLRYCVFLI